MHEELDEHVEVVGRVVARHPALGHHELELSDERVVFVDGVVVVVVVRFFIFFRVLGAWWTARTPYMVIGGPNSVQICSNMPRRGPSRIASGAQAFQYIFMSGVQPVV